jgi:hypothetical protein
MRGVAKIALGTALGIILAAVLLAHSRRARAPIDRRPALR